MAPWRAFLTSLHTPTSAVVYGYGASERVAFEASSDEVRYEFLLLGVPVDSEVWSPERVNVSVGSAQGSGLEAKTEGLTVNLPAHYVAFDLGRAAGDLVRRFNEALVAETGDPKEAPRAEAPSPEGPAEALSPEAPAEGSRPDAQVETPSHSS